MLLHDKVVERIGPDAVRLGSRVTGYRKNADGGVTALIEHADGSAARGERRAADRRRRHPLGGAGADASRPAADPLGRRDHVARHDLGASRSARGASFVGLGTHRHRMVFYPISQPDPETGLSMINWIAEVTMDNSEGWKQSGWFRQVRDRRVRASLRRLDLGLARRAGADPAAPTAPSRTR